MVHPASSAVYYILTTSLLMNGYKDDGVVSPGMLSMYLTTRGVQRIHMVALGVQ